MVPKNDREIYELVRTDRNNDDIDLTNRSGGQQMVTSAEIPVRPGEPPSPPPVASGAQDDSDE